MEINNQPIGVFDSGLGGLTVVRSLISALPNENIIYFGDTGRVPYGTRSAETIKLYARQDEEFLLSKHVKLIIAACGTVSAVAFDTGAEFPVPFMGVLKPASVSAAKTTRNGKIGVIGTSATIKSDAFKKELLRINDGFQVFSKACPLFVPIVEEGIVGKNNGIALLTAEYYLESLKDSGIDTLILGCTHYPIIAEIISRVMGGDVSLIDIGSVTAQAVAKLLYKKNLLANRKDGARHEYYVSDKPVNFSVQASLFLNENIESMVKHIELG